MSIGIPASRVFNAGHEDVRNCESLECPANIDATCTCMPSGDLVIRLTPTADRGRIHWMRDWFGSDYALATALDYEREHGWTWVLPEDVANMTDAPMLTNDGRYDIATRRLKVWGRSGGIETIASAIL